MTGELVGKSEQENEVSGARETAWDDLKNVKMTTSEALSANTLEDTEGSTDTLRAILKKDISQAKTTRERLNILRYNAMAEKLGKAPTLDELVNNAQEAKRPIEKISDDEAVLEYLGTMDELSAGFRNDEDDLPIDYRFHNFAKGAIDDIKSVYGDEIVDNRADDHYLQRENELGMANALIGSLAQIQWELSEVAKKNNQRIGLEAEIRTLEDKLNKAGFFDRLFSPDRRTLKELREKENVIEQNIDMMNRVIEGDKSSFYNTLRRAYGGEQFDEDNEVEFGDKQGENQEVEDQKDQDVFESELYQRFSAGEHGKKIERAVDLYKKLGDDGHKWIRK